MKSPSISSKLQSKISRSDLTTSKRNVVRYALRDNPGKEKLTREKWRKYRGIGVLTLAILEEIGLVEVDPEMSPLMTNPEKLVAKLMNDEPFDWKNSTIVEKMEECLKSFKSIETELREAKLKLEQASDREKAILNFMKAELTWEIFGNAGHISNPSYDRHLRRENITKLKEYLKENGGLPPM